MLLVYDVVYLSYLYGHLSWWKDFRYICPFLLRSNTHVDEKETDGKDYSNFLMEILTLHLYPVLLLAFSFSLLLLLLEVVF